MDDADWPLTSDDGGDKEADEDEALQPHVQMVNGAKYDWERLEIRMKGVSNRDRNY